MEPEGGTGPVERVFAALADPTRRELLSVLGARPPSTASTLAELLPVTRQAIIKHLAVLADCGLVDSHREGRSHLFTVRSTPLLEAAGWLHEVAAGWDDRLAQLKRRAEARADPAPEVAESRSGTRLDP